MKGRHSPFIEELKKIINYWVKQMFKELDLKQITLTAKTPKELDEQYENIRLALKQKGKLIAFTSTQVVTIQDNIGTSFLYVQQIRYKAD